MAATISPVTSKLFDELGAKTESKTASKDLDKNAFMQLMIEQMKSQNPLSPNGGFEQMAAQLAQYTSLEQLQNLNTTMEKLLEMNTSLSTSIAQSSLPSMVGKTVKANFNAINFDGNSSVPFSYSLELPAKELTLEIKDETGKVVRTYKSPAIPMRSGENSYLWDGKNNEGKKVNNGNYTFVLSGKDMQDNDLKITPSVSGRISGVRYRESGPMVVINGAEVPMNSIFEINN